MTRIIRFAGVVTALALLPFLAAEAQAQIVVKTQTPCAAQCGSVGAPGVTTTIRTTTLVAPRPGKAVVSFNGSLYCLSNNPADVFMAFDTQIVENNEAPNVAGRGGLSFTQSFKAATAGSWTHTFNLASSRLFTISSAGTKTYRFRVKSIVMPAAAGCAAYNAAFTIMFFP